MQTIKRWLPLILILSLLACFFIFDLQRFLSFELLKQQRQAILDWKNSHFLLASIGFIALYALATAVSIPGAAFFTIVGGFLFGIIYGSAYVILSATMGATVVFLAVRYALEPFVRQRTSGFVYKMRDGFQRNDFQYLLFLRLVPIFPFWAVNIVPAIFNMKTLAYMIATFMGIIPGSIVYVTLGNGLGHIFDQNQTPNLSIIFDPTILLPILGLALLALLPIGLKYLRGKHGN